jgi:hypothetical protein
MILRASLLSLLAVLTAAIVPAAAQTIPPTAQLRAPSPGVPFYWIDNAPAELVGAAFSDRYGQLLVAELAAVIAESGEPACVQRKGLRKGQLAERARAILLRVGTQTFRLIAGTVSRPELESRFAARMGARVRAELVRLKADPVVRQFIAIEQREQNAHVAEYVAVQLDRYASIARIKLARPISQIDSGNPALVRADPTDETRGLLDAFIATHRSPAFIRYRELIAAAQEALDRAGSLAAWTRLGPGEFMSGLDRALADLCVPGR